MQPRVARRIFGTAILLLPCLLFGVLYNIASERMWKGPEGGSARAVKGRGLYLPASRYKSFGQDEKERGELQVVKVRLSLARGGFARLIFGRGAGGSYDSFCISLDDAIPSGFYRHRPGAGSRLEVPADLQKVAAAVRDAGDLPDERYGALDMTAWERMPRELATDPRLVRVEVEIVREKERLIARVNGRTVASSNRTARFVAGGKTDSKPGLTWGLDAGRFPGCFLKEYSIVYSQGGKTRPHQQSFGELLAKPSGRIKRILKGTAAAVTYCLVSMLLLAWLTREKWAKVAFFEGMVVAVAGLPALAATGSGSALLVGILFVTIVFLLHMVFLLGAGGLRPLRLPVPGETTPSPLAWLVYALCAAGGLALVLAALVQAAGFQWGFRPDYRTDQEITADVDLEKGAVAEIYFRKREDSVVFRRQRVKMPPQWYAFRLSADPKEGSRFVSSMGDERQTDSAHPLTSGRHVVVLKISGDTFTAKVDGEEVDRFRDDALPAGKAGAVVRRGGVRFHSYSVSDKGKGSTDRFGNLLYALAFPLLGSGVLIVLFARVRFAAFLPRFGLALLPLALAGAVVVVLPGVAAGVLRLLPVGGKSADLVVLLRDTPPTATLYAGAALATAALFLLAVQNRARVRFWVVPLLPVAFFFLWYLNGFAARTTMGRAMEIHQRPGGYITRHLYRNGTLSPKEVWDTYSGRFDFRGRGRGVPKKKPAGTVRIVVLGGSSTWGWATSIENTYPAILQRELPQGNVRYEVLNAGARGWTTAMAGPVLEDVLLDYEPDYVIYNFGFNDAARWAPSSHKEALKRQKEDPHIIPLSGVPSALTVFVQSLGSLRKPEMTFTSMVPKEHFAENLQHLADLGERKGFKILLVSEPFDHAGGYESAPLRLPYYDEVMRGIAERRKDVRIEYVPAHTAFQRRSLDDLMTDRVHHTPHGDRILAQAIARTIVRMQAAP